MHDWKKEIVALSRNREGMQKNEEIQKLKFKNAYIKKNNNNNSN